MELLYLILDAEGVPLTQGVLENLPNASTLQFRLPEENGEELAALPGLAGGAEVQMVGLDDSSIAHRGVVTRRRGNRLAVRTTADLGPEARENLRIQTDFESVMYPITGYWKGQRPVKGHDLSCGGVAFHTLQALRPGEVVQVVLPVTDSPLLLRAKVLRELDAEAPDRLYAARFWDLGLDEEMAIRKAVFEIQVSKPRAKT